MGRTAGIKCRGTVRAARGVHVAVSYEFGAAGPAEYCGFIRAACGPGLSRMSRGGVMALIARVVTLTAAKFQGDNIEFGRIVDAARLLIDGKPMNLGR